MYLIAESWFLDPQNLLSLAKAIFGLGIVIFVHELGHFLVAKACGVKCEKFYVGFDVPITIGPMKLPAALWKYKWGETEYGIGAVPLGGYVKMLGQEDNPAHAAAEAERIRTAKALPDGDDGYVLDPRSYPAKSVPQRMAIISAGVIMNLIFGVIFGAAAYWMGVKYEPATVGRTVPGDSAWVNGLAYGDEFLQFDRTGRRDEHMRFNDLKLNVAAKHDARELEVLIRRPGAQPEERWVQLQSVIHKGESLDLPTIGLTPQYSLKYVRVPWDTSSPAANSELEDGDVVMQVKVDDKTYAIADSRALRSVLRQQRSRPVTLVVERIEQEQRSSHDITLLSQPCREYGLRMEMGPVSATKKDSPAETAGFLAGDVLLKINGQPIEDPLRVDDYLQPFIDTSVEITIRRGSQSKQLMVTPATPQASGDAWAVGRPMAAESIGLAYFVADSIASVVAGSPADTAGMMPGDRIIQAQFVWADGAGIDQATFTELEMGKPFEFQAENAWAGFIAISEGAIPRGLNVKFTYQRGDTADSVTLIPARSADRFEIDRGLLFYPVSEIRRAASFTDAWRLGWRETKESALQIFVTLKRISKLWRHMGGPGTIVVAATQEASQGLPRLLLFLTLLSANLAVLNFLPIPVLDGGHIMFLLYEGVFGKPMPERIAFLATMAGLCLILSLMVFVIGMDVYRFLL